MGWSEDGGLGIRGRGGLRMRLASQISGGRLAFGIWAALSKRGASVINPGRTRIDSKRTRVKDSFVFL